MWARSTRYKTSRVSASAIISLLAAAEFVNHFCCAKVPPAWARIGYHCRPALLVGGPAFVQKSEKDRTDNLASNVRIK
jgi:hypothetical protein